MKKKIISLVILSMVFFFTAYKLKNNSSFETDVSTTVKRGDKRVYWVTLHRVTRFELYHSELEVRYHYGSIKRDQIDFRENSVTMVGFEVVDFMNYPNVIIIRVDKMNKFNTTRTIVYHLLARYTARAHGGNRTG